MSIKVPKQFPDLEDSLYAAHLVGTTARMGGLDLERQQGGPTPLKGLKIGTFWQFKHHQLSIIYLSICLSVCLCLSVCRVYSYMCIIEFIYIYIYISVCMCVCVYI